MFNFKGNNLVKHFIMKKLLPLYFFMAFFFSVQGFAQEEESSGHHQTLGVSISHVNIFNGVDNSENKLISLPAWGIDYNYWFNEKWGLGLHTDITVDKFTVDENLGDDAPLERSFPIAPAVMGMRKFGNHTIMFGLGGEFEKNESLFLNRLGYEYGIEVSEKWEVGAAINYDFRWNAYDSYTISIGVSRVLN